MITIVKVGGNVVENQKNLSVLLDGFTALEGMKVLVHGGGKLATAYASRLGIETRMVDGRRITDGDMLKVVTMVYGGLVNKNIVAKLQARGINALGLTGADMNVLLAHKRTATEIDYGFVGDIDMGNGEILHGLIRQGVVPVMAPLTHDGKGSLLNTNADTIAAETAKALVPFEEVRLVYCFEKKGVLGNPDDDDSVVPQIDRRLFEKMVEEGSVNKGMIPKLHNSFSSLDAGVKEVIICDFHINISQGTRLIKE